MLPTQELRTRSMPDLSGYNLSLVSFNLQATENVQEQEKTSGLVWILLFSLLIGLSIITNFLYVLAVATNPRKRTVPHMLVCLFFLVNLVDYALLVFEFTLGMSHHYPYSETSCHVYEYLMESSPLHSAGLVILLTFYASSATSSPSTSRQPGLLSAILLALLAVSIVCIPAVLYSGMAVYPSGARYCVVDLAGVASSVGIQAGRQQALTALYYLLYRSVLPYVLPLCLVVGTLLRLYKRVQRLEDKQSLAGLALAVTSSYFIFYFCLSVLVFIRQSIEISGYVVSGRTSWLLAVLHSLFTLLTVFHHVFRPLLCLSLDIDLRIGLTASLGCSGSTQYTAVQETV